MKADFAEILSQMRAEKVFAGRHLIGSSSIGEEEEYDRLGNLFEQAVRDLSAVHGEPIQPSPQFPGLEVEKAACWQSDNKILYALLTLEDNSRIRNFLLGAARRGEVVRKG